jgi:tetratricopeptide (TPR) repeat protein
MVFIILFGILGIVGAMLSALEVWAKRKRPEFSKKRWVIVFTISFFIVVGAVISLFYEINEKRESEHEKRAVELKEKVQDEKISSLEYSFDSLKNEIADLVANPEDTIRVRQIAEGVKDSAYTIFDSAMVAIGLGYYENALDYLESALIASGNDSLAAVEIFFYKGITQYLGGEPLLALEFFDSSIVYNNDNHRVWNNRGVVLDELGRSEDAISSYDSALFYKQDDHEAWYNRGNALFNLDSLDEAIASYDSAIVYKHDMHDAWYNRGLALAGLSLSIEAIASYDSAIVYKHDKHKAWCNRGIVLGKLNRNFEAIASYDSAIKYMHDDYEAWYNRGNVLGKLGRYLESIASYDSALVYRHDDHEAWYNRSVSFVKLYRDKDALSSCDSALKYNPGNPSYMKTRLLILEEINQTGNRE